MKTLYFDCIGGISGDMTVAALLGFCSTDYLKKELDTLDLNFDISIKSADKNGIAGLSFEVNECNVEHSKHHIGLHDILQLIENSGITSNAKKIASDIFILLGNAEAKVHNTTPDKIHFHEVGAIDSIVDIVSTAVIVDYIKPDQILCSAIRENRGFVKCAHGVLPVPVPAVAEIFAQTKNLLEILDNEYGESVTPTGAAIICTLSKSFGNYANMQINKVSYGIGKKDFDHKPNVLRVLLGETDSALDNVTLIETNLDDITPEALGYTAQKLFENGALDVWFEPIFMKKGRPAYKLCVLCKNQNEKIIDIILSETTAAGLRMMDTKRIVMERHMETAQTPYGNVEVKVLSYNKIEKMAPEYESVRKIAQKNDVEFIKVYESAKNSAFINKK